jgi:TolB protein
MQRHLRTRNGRIHQLPAIENSGAACAMRSRRFLLPVILSIVLSLVLLAGCTAKTRRNPGAVFYLGWDTQDNVQLYLQESGSEAEQITEFAGGVRDYALSPDGRLVALTVKSETGSDEIWVAHTDNFSPRKLHDCQQAACSGIEWAPDSRRLLFELRDIEPDGAAGPPSLWWLDAELGAVKPLFEDNQSRADNGRLSADGSWVAFHSPEEDGLVIYNLRNGSSQFVLNEIGTAVAWNPAGSQLVLPQLDLVILHGDDGDDHEAHEHEYKTAVYLLLVDLETGEQKLIGGGHQGEDSVPQWSPDGEWIAFGRRAQGTGAPRQLWIMRADGSDARALADDPAVNYGPPSWSSDGRFLIFQQIEQDDFDGAPSVWRLDVQTGEKELIAHGAMQPSWVP